MYDIMMFMLFSAIVKNLYISLIHKDRVMSPMILGLVTDCCTRRQETRDTYTFIIALYTYWSLYLQCTVLLFLTRGTILLKRERGDKQFNTSPCPTHYDDVLYIYVYMYTWHIAYSIAQLIENMALTSNCIALVTTHALHDNHSHILFTHRN
jgi:hypothetical protein